MNYLPSANVNYSAAWPQNMNYRYRDMNYAPKAHMTDTEIENQRSA
jgi:hypothetical protein